MIVLGVMLAISGRRALVAAMILVAAATAGLVVLERVVVTEREEVADTLDSIAQSLVANDVPAVVGALSKTCPRRAEVQSVLSHVTVSGARVGGDLEVTVNRLTSPPSATTTFTGRIDAKDNRGTVPYEHIFRKFKVTLHKEGDRWLITNFDDTDVRPGQRI